MAVMEGSAHRVQWTPGGALDRRFSANTAVPRYHMQSAGQTNLKFDPSAADQLFIEILRDGRREGYIIIESAGSVWGEDCDAVAFDCASGLAAQSQKAAA